MAPQPPSPSDGAPPVRVLIVDDSQPVRDGLARVLASLSIQVLGTADSGPDAVAHYRTTRPDVVLMDLHMPTARDGLDATRQIRSVDPAARVIILTAFDHAADVDQALMAGAVGYILKDATPEQIAEAIEAARRDQSPLDPRVAAAAMRRLIALRELDALSPRDRHALTLLARGRTNAEIARSLGVAPLTVKSHLRHLYKRIGVTGRHEAADWASRHGLDNAQPRQ